MFKIFIIEDDKGIARQVAEHLDNVGFKCEVSKDMNNILPDFIKAEADLVLLDLMLPNKNGFYYCTEIRKFSTMPIIFISSAQDNFNIMTAMDLGADDFICKPFDLNVLTAKINSLLRRTYSYRNINDTLEHNGIILDLIRGRIVAESGEVELSKNELLILKLLMENSSSLVSRDSLMDFLWNTDSFIDDNTLSVNINRIRKKLADIGKDNYIKTKKGLGYFV